MQAVVLAGGLGTRLRPMTTRVPKPMIEVGGEPFLAYIVRWLGGNGFQHLLFLVGYLGHLVEHFFGDGSKFGVTIDYAWEQEPLGTGGAIRNALDKLDSEFLLLYGDSFLPIDYCEVVHEFRNSASRGLMVVYEDRDAATDVLGNVDVDSDGWVQRYQKGEGSAGLRYIEAGALCFRREVFVEMPAGRPVSMEQEVYPQLIAGRNLRAYVTEQRFFDIGTPARLEKFAASLR